MMVIRTRIFYIISWNEDKYNADNTKGWEATKSNDEAETPTNTIGTAQLGCPHRRTQCPEINLVQQMAV